MPQQLSFELPVTPQIKAEIGWAGAVAGMKQAGPALRDLGTAMTLEAEGEEWKDRAMRELGNFARRFSSFTAEEFRAHWLGLGHLAPHTHKVWGALFLSAARKGIIRSTGRYQRATSAKTHAHPVCVWECEL